MGLKYEMDATARKIEIFEPFGAALEVMKRILFQPFDLKKWCVIGFAAFIGGAWGSGFGFNRLGNVFNGNSRFGMGHRGEYVPPHLPPWFIPGMVVLGVLLLAIALTLAWVFARGRFVLTDCIVHNRAAIAAPWHEFRREGNSYFLFTLGVIAITLIIVAVFCLAVALPLGILSGIGRASHHAGHGLGAMAILGLACFALLWVAIAVYLSLALNFMVPVMYRRRCRATEAFGEIARLITRHPGIFILFALFSLVLGVALAIVSTLVACMTCCIGALPYVSTVLLLPALIWLRAFHLCFIRQFGSDYDVWANLSPAPAPPAAPPVEPPPLPA